MPDQILPAYPISDRYPFPVLRLGRAFRIATDFRKLFLGGIALLVLSAGNLGINYLPFAPSGASDRVPTSSELWETEFDYTRHSWFQVHPLPLLGLMLEPSPALLWRQALQWDILLRPLRTVIEPAAMLVRPGLTWSLAAWAVTKLVWALIVWSVFGGAITRMAAVQFARDEKISARAALRFSLAKFISHLCAPLLPLTGVAILGGLCALGGLLGRIPDVGPVIVGGAWLLPLALAFLMTLMLLGTAVGWPLMTAAISTEASDAFDGFSRSYSFVFSRPWHYAGYTIFALIYGSLLLVFVAIVASLVASLAAWGIGLGMGSTEVAQLNSTAPNLLGGRSLTVNAALETPKLATHLTSGWLFALSMLVVGFVVSYFWTAATILYFLLRNVDDATGFDEVWLPELEEQDDLLPLAGVAASEQPVVERPVRPMAGPSPSGNQPG